MFTIFSYSITDSVRALFDTWIVGDMFLKDLDITYEAIRKQVEKSSVEDRPYLLKYYNVRLFYKFPPVGVSKAATRIVNSLIERFNIDHRLPRFIVVIVDKDIIKDINVYDGFAPLMTQDAIQWLVRQVNDVVSNKKTEIMKKCPESIFSGDPKIIFVRMLRRVEKYTPSSKLDLLFGLRSKFNDALNSAVAEIDQRILTITSCNSRDHFNYQGNLTVKGRYDYWREIDDLLDRFDRRGVKLLPTPLHPNRISLDKPAHEEKQDKNNYKSVFGFKYFNKKRPNNYY